MLTTHRPHDDGKATQSVDLVKNTLQDLGSHPGSRLIEGPNRDVDGPAPRIFTSSVTRTMAGVAILMVPGLCRHVACLNVAGSRPCSAVGVFGESAADSPPCKFGIFTTQPISLWSGKIIYSRILPAAHLPNGPTPIPQHQVIAPHQRYPCCFEAWPTRENAAIAHSRSFASPRMARKNLRLWWMLGKTRN